MADPTGTIRSGGRICVLPGRRLLATVALESQRAGAFVTGEDLATVTEEVRAEPTMRSILSYEVIWFEEEPPVS